MNKARITYRMDAGEPNRRNGGGGDHGQPPKRVIPLFEEEFRVVPDQVEEKEQRRSRAPEMEWEQGREREGERERERELAYERESIGRQIKDRVREQEWEEEGGREHAVRPQTSSPFSPWRDPQALNPYTNDYGAWETSFETEADRVERTIRDSEERRRYPEPVRHVERGREEWDEADERGGSRYEVRQETPVYESPNVPYRTFTRQPNTPWLKLTLSVTGAALTGVLLGFFVLQLFSGNLKADVTNALDADAVDTIAKVDSSGAGGAAPSAQPSGAAGGTQTAAAGAGAGAAAGSGVVVNLPGRTVTVMQGGSFASEQGAQTLASDLQKKGYAAVVEKSADRFNVYLAMGQSRDKILGLSQRMKQEKTDVILKDYAIPSVASVKWNGSADALSTYITETDKLVGTISSLTLLHLEETKLSALDDSTMQSLKTAHESWTKASIAVAEGLPEAGKTALQKMNNAMNTAKKSLDEYKKTPSTAMLWQAQSYVIQCSVAEKELLAAIAVK